MKKVLLLFIFNLFTIVLLHAQEIGVNFNHNPEILDFKYLELSQAEWIRTTPNIMYYVHHGKTVHNSDQFSKVVEAGKRGYKIAFGFRWHFKENNLNIPQPNTPEEQLYFTYVDSILNIVGPYVNIFKLGNEPQFETLSSDMEADGNGEIPLVRFTKRLYEKSVYPYFNATRGDNMPEIYVGSIPRLFAKNLKNNASVTGMLEYVQNTDGITGLALHLHIKTFAEAEEAFKYARTFIPTKPFIIPEFSFQLLFKSKLEETIGVNAAGKAFATEYGRSPDWKLHEYYSYINTNKITRQEWDDFFGTRTWFPKNFLLHYYHLYQQYSVRFASYPLLQQSTPKKVTPGTNIWFVNPIFCQKNLFPGPNGNFITNPVSYNDFITIVNKGKGAEKKTTVPF